MGTLEAEPVEGGPASSSTVVTAYKHFSRYTPMCRIGFCSGGVFEFVFGHGL
jgi:hypothetical protein